MHPFSRVDPMVTPVGTLLCAGMLSLATVVLTGAAVLTALVDSRLEEEAVFLGQRPTLSVPGRNVTTAV